MSQSSLAEEVTSKSIDATRPSRLRVADVVSRVKGAETQPGRTPDVSAFQFDWKSQKAVAVEISRQPAPVNVVPATAPGYVHEFAMLVMAVKNVNQVVAETGEEGAVHLTTFAVDLTEESRNQIYMIEAETILRHPHVMFDFHLRCEEEAGGSPKPIAAKYYYAIWGNANVQGADESATPQAGG